MNLHLDLQEVLLHTFLEEANFYSKIGKTSKQNGNFTVEKTSHIRTDHLDNVSVVYDFSFYRPTTINVPNCKDPVEVKLLVEIGLPKECNNFHYEVCISVPPSAQLTEDSDGHCGLNLCTFDPISLLEMYTLDVTKHITKQGDTDTKVLQSKGSVLGPSDYGCLVINRRPVKYNPELLDEIYITFNEMDVNKQAVNSEYRRIAKQTIQSTPLAWNALKKL